MCCFLFASSYQYSLTHIITFIWKSLLPKIFSIVKLFSEVSSISWTYFIFESVKFLTHVYFRLHKTVHWGLQYLFTYLSYLLYSVLNKWVFFLVGKWKQKIQYTVWSQWRLSLMQKKKHRYWTGIIKSGSCSYSISVVFCDQILPLDLQELL